MRQARTMHSSLWKLLDQFAEGSQGPDWQPAADIYQCGSGWLLKFELAGVRPDDIQVTAHGRSIQVAGIRKDLAIESQSRCYSMEISYNRFHRAVELPSDLEQAVITTEYRDGMLFVRVTSERS